MMLLVAFLGSLVPVELMAQSRYDSLIPGADTYKTRNPPDGAGNARLGRTLGGAAGIAAGSFGGAALAAAVIKGAGLASMGPIVPIIVGTAITAGGAFLGAKLLSSLGQSGDRMLGPGTTWTLVGAIAGSILGYALIPAMGPFAGPAGRIIAAGVAGLAGGILAKLFAPQLDKLATPRNIYAGAGAVIGAVGFGPIGAVAGAAGGYALGAIFGDVFFADKSSSPGQYVDQVGWQASRLTNKARSWTDTIGDWFRDRTDNFQDRMHDNWNYYDQNSGYYDNFQDSRRCAYDVIGYDQMPYSQDQFQSGYYDYLPPSNQNAFDFSFSAGTGYNQMSLSISEYKLRLDSAMRNYQSVQRSGRNQQEIYQAYTSYQQAEQQYRSALQYSR
jgi:hypothetical protein